MKMDIYQTVTDSILAQLDAGTVPWKRPWKDMLSPRNLISDKRYNGINFLLLGMRGYKSPYWLTFKQGKTLGGAVRKGEKSTLITFWKFLESKDDDGRKRQIPLLRYYRVFNVEQFDGLKLPKRATEEPREFEPIEAAKAIVEKYPKAPQISHGGDRACYIPKRDSIHMPKPEDFDSSESYYSTLFHEMGHSTGHSSRLDRGLDADIPAFGSEDYSKEELVAEFCSAFLCAEARMSQDQLPQSAAYIASWRKRLIEDPKLLIQAAGKAQKAANHILDKDEYAKAAA